jgi:hypothetical protein
MGTVLTPRLEPMTIGVSLLQGAFKNNVPLLEVMKAGTWKKHTTFTDFYLKDLTSLQNGLRSLGTLSVAQHIV